MPQQPSKAEQDEIIEEIRAAFDGVIRGTKGTSWSEAVAHDNYESEEVCLEARRSDRDTSWEQLVDDKKWHPFPGVGGFSFVNTEGFRYYLPPTLIRIVRLDNSEWYPGHLLQFINRFTEADDDSRWTPQQLRAIARCMQFLSRYDPETLSEVESGDPNVWEGAFKARWSSYL